MRVVLVNPAPLDVMKGTERFLLLVGNHLAERGHSVTYLTDSGFRLAYPGLEVRARFRVVSAPFKRFGSFYFLPKDHLASIRPEVVYLNTFTLYPVLPDLKCAYILGTHTIDPSSFRTDSAPAQMAFELKSLALRIAALLSYSRSPAVIHAINPTQCEWLKGHGFSRFPVRTVPLLVDSTVYFAESALWGSGSRFTILFVGGLDKSKGILTFIELATRLRRQGLDDIQFQVIGWGEYSRLVRETARSVPGFEYLGAVRESEKRHLYNRAKLLVSPSEFETFHMVSAEAQLCGLPVVSSNLAGPQIVLLDGVTGTLVPRKSLPAFEAAILHYYNLWRTRPEDFTMLRTRSSENGRRFAASVVLPRLEEIFEEALTLRNRRYNPGELGETSVVQS